MTVLAALTFSPGGEVGRLRSQIVVDRKRTKTKETELSSKIPLELSVLASPFREYGRLSVRLERLPPKARLSAGSNNGDATWSLMLDELDGLEYLPPKGFAEDHTLLVRIVCIEDGDAATLAQFDLLVSPTDGWAGTMSGDDDDEESAEGDAAAGNGNNVVALTASISRSRQRAQEKFDSADNIDDAWMPPDPGSEQDPAAIPHPAVQEAAGARVAELEARIGRRVEAMLAQGLVAEVDSLRQGAGENRRKLLQTIGYREVVDFLDGRCSRTEMRENITLHTRQYAKRQLTWFRKDKSIIWVDSSRESARILSLIDDFMTH